MFSVNNWLFSRYQERSITYQIKTKNKNKHPSFFFLWYQILESAINWLKHDWEHRKLHTFNLLKKIRLGLVPFDRLKTLLGEEILAIPECKNLMGEVVKLHATVGSTQVPLNQSHPDMFANRNTVTVSTQ